jgi:hypothetical protein
MKLQSRERKYSAPITDSASRRRLLRARRRFDRAISCRGLLAAAGGSSIPGNPREIGTFRDSDNLPSTSERVTGWLPIRAENCQPLPYAAQL